MTTNSKRYACLSCSSPLTIWVSQCLGLENVAINLQMSRPGGWGGEEGFGRLSQSGTQRCSLDLCSRTWKVLDSGTGSCGCCPRWPSFSPQHVEQRRRRHWTNVQAEALGISRPALRGGGEALPLLIPEATSVIPGDHACWLFTRLMVSHSADDNFNATQKGLRSYLNIHTKLPWAQLSR